MRKPRAKVEVLNDLDGQVVNLFRVLRDKNQAEELQRITELTPFGREEYEASYSTSDEPVERARRLLVRSFFGRGNSIVQLNGFKRTRRGAGSLSSNSWATWPQSISAFTRRLEGVILENRSALHVIDVYDAPDALFYVDPPYPASTRHKSLYTHEMGDDEPHRELAVHLRTCTGMVVLSGYDCALYAELYGDWQRVSKQTRCMSNGMRTEVLWINPSAWRALNKA